MPRHIKIPFALFVLHERLRPISRIFPTLVLTFMPLVSIKLKKADTTQRLFCWILGGSNEFSVKIGKSEMVDDLKAAIKKRREPELDQLAADALSVWKVGKSFPMCVD